MNQLSEDFLKHYGVLGMKWGVRKDRKGGVRKARPPKKTRYQKRATQLSDNDLRKRIARMEAEKRYNQLNTRTVSSGEKLAADILKNSGKTVAGALITGALYLGVKQALSSVFGKRAASLVIRRD